jgi:hypothetical protein
VSFCSSDFLGPYRKAGERVRAKGRADRDVRGIAAAGDQHPADARSIIASIKGVPLATDMGFEPGGEIHRRVRDRYADIAQIAGAVSRRDVHAATESDGEVGVIPADASAIAESFPSRPACARVFVAKGEPQWKGGSTYGGDFYDFVVAVERCLRTCLPEVRDELPVSSSAIGDGLRRHWASIREMAGDLRLLSDQFLVNANQISGELPKCILRGPAGPTSGGAQSLDSLVGFVDQPLQGGLELIVPPGPGHNLAQCPRRETPVILTDLSEGGHLLPEGFLVVIFGHMAPWALGAYGDYGCALAPIPVLRELATATERSECSTISAASFPRIHASIWAATRSAAAINTASS